MPASPRRAHRLGDKVGFAQTATARRRLLEQRGAALDDIAMPPADGLNPAITDPAGDVAFRLVLDHKCGTGGPTGDLVPAHSGDRLWLWTCR